MTGTPVGGTIPPLTGGERQWVVGRCWLYCARENVTVSWLGPVWSSGAQAPLFACSDCIVNLDRLVRQYLAAKDGYKEPRRYERMPLDALRSETGPL
ncbi:hypothetical protein ACWCXE_12775 [Streptomyces sp. NPDC001780]